MSCKLAGAHEIDHLLQVIVVVREVDQDVLPPPFPFGNWLGIGASPWNCIRRDLVWFWDASRAAFTLVPRACFEEACAHHIVLIDR